MNIGLILLLAIVIILPIMLAVAVIGMYNSLVKLNIKTDEAWSDITVQLKRRADLIPNLVETVKGYAAHEKGVFEKVTEARSAIMSATHPAEAAKADGELSMALKSLFAVSENYPELKASSNFMELQTQITDTEDKISASRRFYNANVTQFNTKRKVFPTNIFAGMLGFNSDKEFFNVSEAEQAAIEKPAEVKF